MLRFFRDILKDWNAKRNTADTGVRDVVAEPAIHIHEDDWGMRNLYPVEASSHAADDIAKAAEAGERNRAPDGVGWTDVHVISAPSIDYTATNLSLADAAAALEAIMPRIRKFIATATAGLDPKVRDPWGAYEVDAYCYGFDRFCYIKLEPVGDRIKHIWFECTTEKPERAAALREALLAIDGLAPSTVADYWLDVAGAVHDATFLDRYFRALVGEKG